MRIRLYMGSALGILIFASSVMLCGQSISIPRDAQGMKLVQGSKTTLIGNRELNDGVLQGQYKARFWGDMNFGADVKLEFLGERHSRAYVNWRSVLILQGTEICTLDNRGEITGAWAQDAYETDSPSGGKVLYTPPAKIRTPGEGSFTNCWSAPVWFFPAMIMKSMADDPHTAVLYCGRVSNHGQALEVLRSYQVAAGKTSTHWENLTVSEVHLDAQTLLPVSIRFWRSGGSNVPVPTADPLSPSNHPVEVHYSDYRKVDGISVPFSVEWSNPGDLLESLSIKIEKVRLNTGLKATDFALPSEVEPSNIPQPQNP